MQDLKAELLRGLWYVALPGATCDPAACGIRRCSASRC